MEKEERYERKFFISDLTLREVEVLILHNPLMFSEIFNEREVNNMYFDFENMENYTDNVIGISQRFKIRIRWYGNLYGLIEKPILELKIKNGETLKKLSSPLKPFTFDKQISKVEFKKEMFDKANLPDWLNETLKLTSPSLLNSYTRKYFLSSNKRYRITLDSNFAFFNIQGKNNSFNKGIRDKHNIVLEIKYGQEDEDKIEQITQHFPFRLTKNSKYVSGIDCLC